MLQTHHARNDSYCSDPDRRQDSPWKHWGCPGLLWRHLRIPPGARQVGARHASTVLRALLLTHRHRDRARDRIVPDPNRGLISLSLGPESNRRPAVHKTAALPAELPRRATGGPGGG